MALQSAKRWQSFGKKWKEDRIMNSLQRVAQLEAMLARIIVEDNRACAMSDYRSGADFNPLRRAIAISRGAFPLGTDYYVKAGMMYHEPPR
jgi:hypothetical protein